MSSEKKDFFGKTVADAIKQACDTLNAQQEGLDIEVIETGSTGIFGFIRKKAHIRAACRPTESDTTEEAPDSPAVTTIAKPEPVIAKPAPSPAQQKVTIPAPPIDTAQVEVDSNGDDEDSTDEPDSNDPLSDESIHCVREELSQLLTLMGIPSRVETETQGNSLRCHIIGEFQEDLCGQEGKTLDSLQYLLRKIVTRKVTERVRISIDVGDYREKRQDELQELALQLAAQVKEDGKTQIIPSLNPSERRVVHMTLQEDKDIRSRSVGDGLFKKVLIYKPGSKPGSGSSGRKRPQARGKRGRGGKQGASDNIENSESSKSE